MKKSEAIRLGSFKYCLHFTFIYGTHLVCPQLGYHLQKVILIVLNIHLYMTTLWSEYPELAVIKKDKGNII